MVKPPGPPKERARNRCNGGGLRELNSNTRDETMPQAPDDGKKYFGPQPQPPGPSPGEPETYPIIETLIAYNADSGAIIAGSKSAGRDWWRACGVFGAEGWSYFEVSPSGPLTPDMIDAAVLAIFWHVVEAGADPGAVHREFNKIKEYRAGLRASLPALPMPHVPCRAQH